MSFEKPQFERPQFGRREVRPESEELKALKAQRDKLSQRIQERLQQIEIGRQSTLEDRRELEEWERERGAANEEIARLSEGVA